MEARTSYNQTLDRSGHQNSSPARCRWERSCRRLRRSPSCRARSIGWSTTIRRLADWTASGQPRVLFHGVHGEFVNPRKNGVGAGSLVRCRHRATVQADDSPAHTRRPPAGHHCKTRAPGRSTCCREFAHERARTTSQI
jgi:hypothetical protein